MRRCACGHRLVRVAPVLSVAALLVVCCGSSTAAAATVPKAKPKTKSHVLLGPLTGTWLGSYGGAFSGKFTLRWTQTGTRLRGSIVLSLPRGKYGINGRVRGNKIGFGAVGAGATYTGTVSGKSMSGTYKTGQGGGSWSAHKTS